MLVQVLENMLYKVKRVDNNRLSEMGFIRGTIFRIVKRVAGMIQLRFDDSNVVIRKETLNDVDIEENRNVV